MVSYDRKSGFQSVGIAVSTTPDPGCNPSRHIHSYRYGEFTLSYKFKYDGETYTGEVQDGLSGYIKKGNWVKSYWDSKLYANWLNHRHFVRY